MMIKVDEKNSDQPPKGLDLGTIWFTWACPSCKHLNYQTVEELGFGFDIDLIKRCSGHVETYLEVTCQVCGKQFSKSLSCEQDEPKDNL